MADLAKRFPPYEGDEPYFYFAFAQTDGEKAAPILERLYARGCRVWYPAEKARTAKERQNRLEHTKGASLAVIYLSEAALADADEVKSSVLFCQSKGIPVICLDAVESSRLSTGFTSSTRHISAQLPPEALEAALIRTEGFSQKLLGVRQETAQEPGWKKAAAGALALLVAALGIAWALGVFAPKDTVTIPDDSLQKAVRQEVGGAITQENLLLVERLRLEAVPEDLESLKLLPNLTRVEIPAAAAADAEPLLERYTVVVYGG